MKTSHIKFLHLVLLLTTVFQIHAQISGNQVYGNNHSNYNHSSNKTITVNNNVLSVSIYILMNSKADGFVMTLGLNEEDTTVKLCNAKINTRIDGFLSKIKSLGIKKRRKLYRFHFTNKSL